MSEPLVPSDADVRGFKDMPMEVSRLLSSETWIMCTPEERSAAINLWFHSWTQVPAGSLPDNDRVLAHLSMASERWPEVKEMALRGWVKADDGRLYHTVVCEKVNAMLAVRARKSDAGRKGGSVSKPLKTKKKHKQEAVAKQQLNDSEAPDKLQPSSLPFPSLPSEKKDSSLPLGDPVEADFEEWYQLYPHKVGRGQALKAYRSARKKTGKGELLESVKRFAAAKARDGTEKRFIPHPATWLNGERWADEAQPSLQASSPAGGNGQARPGEYQARDPADFDLEDWTVRIKLYRQNGKWAETWGPRPPAEGDIAELARGYLAKHRRAA